MFVTITAIVCINGATLFAGSFVHRFWSITIGAVFALLLGLLVGKQFDRCFSRPWHCRAVSSDELPTCFLLWDRVVGAVPVVVDRGTATKPFAGTRVSGTVLFRDILAIVLGDFGDGDMVDTRDPPYSVLLGVGMEWFVLVYFGVRGA